MLIVTLILATKYTKDVGFDYPFNDIKNVNSNTTHCRSLCDKQPNCTGFVMDKAGSNCWLKSLLTGRTKNIERLSYLKEIPAKSLASQKSPKSSVLGSDSKTIIIITVCGGVSVIILALFLFYLRWRRNRKKLHSKPSPHHNNSAESSRSGPTNVIFSK